MLGFALGCVGLSYDDFACLTPEEFAAVCKSYNSGVENRERSEWERVRTAVSILIQPYMKKRVSPADILPFPWDKAGADIKSLAADKAALARLKARLGGGTYSRRPENEVSFSQAQPQSL